MQHQEDLELAHEHTEHGVVRADPFAWMADTTPELITRDPRQSRFRAWLDEEVLADIGITDLKKYRCVPDEEPTTMSIELVDPGWSERHGRV